MIGFGILIGIVFPYFVMLFGVGSQIIQTKASAIQENASVSQELYSQAITLKNMVASFTLT